MNYSTAVFLINKTVRAVTVSYEPSPSDPNVGHNPMVFKTLDQSIKPKDMVVIPTDTRWKMTMGRVEAVDVDVDFDSPTQIKWLMGNFDKGAYELVLAQEQDAITAIRSAEVRQKREALAKALFADNEGLKSLPIASVTGDALPPPVQPPAPE